MYYLQDVYDIGIDKVKSFCNKFEEYYPIEIEMYGEHTDMDANGKVILLIARLTD